MDRFIRIWCNGYTYLYDTETHLVELENGDGTTARLNTTGTGTCDVHGGASRSSGQEEDGTGSS